MVRSWLRGGGAGEEEGEANTPPGGHTKHNHLIMCVVFFLLSFISVIIKTPKIFYKKMNGH